MRGRRENLDLSSPNILLSPSPPSLPPPHLTDVPLHVLLDDARAHSVRELGLGKEVEERPETGKGWQKKGEAYGKLSIAFPSRPLPFFPPPLPCLLPHHLLGASVVPEGGDLHVDGGIGLLPRVRDGRIG